MGQGQEIHARNMIADCVANGGWVLLQNMHLSLPFCTEAMDALADSEEIHGTFRMWITTEVHPQFPIALLQVNVTPAVSRTQAPAIYRIRVFNKSTRTQ